MSWQPTDQRAVWAAPTPHFDPAVNPPSLPMFGRPSDQDGSLIIAFGPLLRPRNRNMRCHSGPAHIVHQNSGAAPEHQLCAALAGYRRVPSRRMCITACKTVDQRPDACLLFLRKRSRCTGHPPQHVWHRNMPLPAAQCGQPDAGGAARVRMRALVAHQLSYADKKTAADAPFAGAFAVIPAPAIGCSHHTRGHAGSLRSTGRQYQDRHAPATWYRAAGRHLRDFSANARTWR